MLLVVLMRQGGQKPKVYLVDPDLDPQPEHENLLVYHTQGGYEKDQVTHTILSSP